MVAIDVAEYGHSPVHKAVILKDYSALMKIIAGLPVLIDPSEIRTESISLAEEAKADARSAVIDRRDVPNKDTPLHLAVKFGDGTSAEMLMLAGVDWSLRNEHGWSALQEAICNREEGIAKIIVKHYRPLAWAKWCRMLLRLVGSLRRMRDFYMEITFHFESSVIPFFSRVAPSDTYKIWKRGANLRTDLTLAGFDGFRIKRSNQSVLFLGDGSKDGKVSPGSLCMVSHKEKEVMISVVGARAPASEAEVHKQVTSMSQRNIFRSGIDVTEAVLIPQTTWQKNEKTEMVGFCKAKVYDMHNVVVSVKSRRVPGAMTDDELSNVRSENETESKLEDVLTEEESQLEIAVKMDSSYVSNEKGDEVTAHRHTCYEERDIPRHSVDVIVKGDGDRRVTGNKAASSKNSEIGNRCKDGNHENEYKKGLRPILWLSPDFLLRTDELLPLLDILGNKIKAVRRLRELLTTKLPMGTFPVKVAIPVVPTIRVMVTFTKFEELQPLDDFSTPPSNPDGQSSSSSWFQWMKTPYQQLTGSAGGSNCRIDNFQDLFAIPSDYKRITIKEKKKKSEERKNLKKRKLRNSVQVIRNYIYNIYVNVVRKCNCGVNNNSSTGYGIQL